MAVHVGYKSLLIPLPSHAKQEPEMAKFAYFEERESIIIWNWMLSLHI